MTTRKFKRLLRRELGYREDPARAGGSHVWLRADGRPDIRWAFHDREMAPVEVRAVLTRQVGLTVDEAKEVFRRA